ncbi:MAG: hypothetical protein HY900_31385 [Deltaproteobacteria bacterium]|nr:hypothetical protein [Deltaproteobacteria bacterium]
MALGFGSGGGAGVGALRTGALGSPGEALPPGAAAGVGAGVRTGSACAAERARANAIAGGRALRFLIRGGP